MTKAASELLTQTLARGTSEDASGTMRKVHSDIGVRFAEALSRTVSALKPKLCLEIGLATGVSALAILAELEEGSKLISIDPFQDKAWHGMGSKLIANAGLAHMHELIQEFDYIALPRLLSERTPIDFAYIDGMHTFDYVMLDTFFVDKLLRIDGIVGFNDCGFRSVHKFLKFFRSHRRYEEVNVGLPKDFQGRNSLVSLERWITGRSNSDRYFRKLADWEPPHNFFKSF